MAKVQKAMKICLITPGHLISDPRIIKEATALSENGFRVHLIFTQYLFYLANHDQHILDAHPEWTYDSLDWTGSSIVSKLKRLRSKFYAVLAKNGITVFNRNHRWMVKKAISNSADLYIAHNLGALPVAVIAARKNNAKCGFDAEDFHRFEMSNDLNDFDVKLNIKIEDHYIPMLNYLTASSPQIADKYLSLYQLPVETLLNTFPRTSNTSIAANITHPLNLFWFSQTVGANRGLEAVIHGIGIAGVRINLHLLGDVNKEYEAALRHLTVLIAPLCNLQFYAPVQAEHIFEIACKFDIGMAAEPNIPLNRDICLTNKLFTYIQSGLAVLASNTTAQVAFLKKLPNAGLIYKDAISLANAISTYHFNRQLLLETKKINYHTGQLSLNWESEVPKFLKIVYKTIA
jgi:hypothetical protein